MKRVCVERERDIYIWYGLQYMDLLEKGRETERKNTEKTYRDCESHAIEHQSTLFLF